MICECSDPKCLVHTDDDSRSTGKLSECQNVGTVTLYRVDMEDETGTVMCEDCANDAYESGLFTDGFDGDEEDQ